MFRLPNIHSILILAALFIAIPCTAQIQPPLEYWSFAKHGLWETERYWVDSTLTSAEIDEYDFIWSGQCMIGVLAEDVQCAHPYQFWRQADSLQHLRKILLPTKVKIMVRLYFDAQAKPRAAWIVSDNTNKDLSYIVFHVIKQICCVPAINNNRQPMPAIAEIPFVFF